MILVKNQLEELVQGEVSTPLVIMKCPKACDLALQWIIKIIRLVNRCFPSTFSRGKTPVQSMVFKHLRAKWEKIYIHTSAHFTFRTLDVSQE